MIKGNPVAQQRHRHTQNHKGNIWAYDPLARDKAVLRHGLAADLKEQAPSFEMFEYPNVRFRFYMKIPKYMPKKLKEKARTMKMRHVKKPDCDNLQKYYLDCMSKIFFHDDRAVKIDGAEKVYSTDPRVEIEIVEGSQFEDDQETVRDAFQDCVVCGTQLIVPKRIPTFSESPTY